MVESSKVTINKKLNDSWRFLAPAIFLFVTSTAFAVSDIVPGDGWLRPGYGFILPNEMDYFYFNPALQTKTGVLIGVGTFRFFHDLSQGNFELGISFDYAIEVSHLNLGLLKVFQASESRFHFLGKLLGVESIKEFENLLRRFEAGEVSADEVSKQVLSSKDQNKSNLQKIASENLFSSQVNVIDVLVFGKRLFQLYLGSMSQHQVFLRSDLLFNRIKKMIEEKRVIVVHGNLGGKKTLQELGHQLRQARQTISIINVSNSYNYISSQNIVRQYLMNLKSLPFGENALILLTEGLKPKTQIRTDGWEYIAVPIQSYLNSPNRYRKYNWVSPKSDYSLTGATIRCEILF